MVLRRCCKPRGVGPREDLPGCEPLARGVLQLAAEAVRATDVHRRQSRRAAHTTAREFRVLVCSEILQPRHSDDCE